jgi:hypothetical protein
MTLSVPRSTDFWHTLYGMSVRWACLFTICFCLVVVSLPAQAQQTPTITFTLDFPKSDPSHYMISISSDGHASYTGNGRFTPKSSMGVADDDKDPDAEHIEFTASPQVVTKIFALAKNAKYFQGEIDSKKRTIASTGQKTLTYKDSNKNTQATYNYSPIPAVQELTHIFQGLASTLEFGRRLNYFYHHQKLALDQEMKLMEDSAKGGDLQGISAVAPILQKIADDKAVINVVRARAMRILATPEDTK